MVLIIFINPFYMQNEKNRRLEIVVHHRRVADEVYHQKRVLNHLVKHHPHMIVNCHQNRATIQIY